LPESIRNLALALRPEGEVEKLFDGVGVAAALFDNLDQGRGSLGRRRQDRPVAIWAKENYVELPAQSRPATVHADTAWPYRCAERRRGGGQNIATRRQIMNDGRDHETA
jgi:hypothetical protein